MRQLTVKRNKTAVGCAVKLKIYAADPQGDVTINGLPCVKLGELKNGEEKTFEITEAETRIFAIADQVSKDFCCDSAPVPAGTEPVYLSGKNKFNMSNGNAFIFDGEPDDFALLHRSKGSKKGVIILIAALIVGLVIGFIATSGVLEREKNVDITYHELTMTLTNKFKEQKSPAAQNSDSRLFGKGKNSTLELAVYLTREEISEDIADITAAEYAEVMISVSPNAKGATVLQKDGLTYFRFTHTAPVNGNDTVFYYTVFVFKGEEAFYLVQMYTTDKSVHENEDRLLSVAGTVRLGAK